MREEGSRAMRSLPGMEDTIVAIATAPGRGAVGIVRLSGARALEIGRRHIVPWNERPNEIHLADVRDTVQNLLDRALVSVFCAPNSFTGEDIVEVSTHGGTVVPQSVVAAFIAAGARQAEAGEFTRRAVANGKIDICARRCSNLKPFSLTISTFPRKTTGQSAARELHLTPRRHSLRFVY
jgi:tRNA U34 5-carboxymethylaminomethyl modifying GTPase MnmE/TrmE